MFVSDFEIHFLSTMDEICEKYVMMVSGIPDDDAVAMTAQREHSKVHHNRIIMILINIMTNICNLQSSQD